MWCIDGEGVLSSWGTMNWDQLEGLLLCNAILESKTTSSSSAADMTVEYILHYKVPFAKHLSCNRDWFAALTFKSTEECETD